MADWAVSGDGRVTELLGMDAGTGVTAAQTVTSGAGVGLYSALWTQVPLRDVTTGVITGTGATTFDASGFIYTSMGNSAGASQFVIDIGVGPSAGAVTTIVQRLYVNNAGSTNRGGYSVFIPIAIPALTLMWVRIASSSTVAVTMAHTITMIGSGWRGQSFSKCTTYNMSGTVFDGLATDGISPGALIYCDPGGVASVWSSDPLGTGDGAWRTISQIDAGDTTTLQRSCSMVMFALAPLDATDSTVTARWAVDIAIGAGANPTPVFTNIIVQNNATPDRIHQPFIGPVPLSLPSGVQVVARVIISVAAAAGKREIGVVMYVFA
jgi:hypothetical protein